MNKMLILEEHIEEIELRIEVDLPPFTDNHGDPCFDEEQATINEIFASCDLYPVPVIE
jgi:hypothetical protein